MRRIPGKHSASKYEPKLREPPAEWTPDWLDRMNHNYKAVQTLRANLAQMESDVSGGQPETLSWFQRRLCLHLLWCDVMLENLERRFARGNETVDERVHAYLLTVQANVSGRLGLERRQRDVTTLEAYVAAKGRAA